MVNAFIMIKTVAGKSEELLSAVEASEGITEAHIVAEATGPEVYDVMQSVATRVRDLEGVADTRTYICLE